MASSSSADLQRVKARAEETDRILADLQSQIAAIRQVAVRQAGLGEEEKLMKENEELKKEVQALKTALTVAEIANGVRQVPLLTKGTIDLKVKQAHDLIEQSATASAQPEVKEEKPKAEKPNKGQKKQNKQEDASKTSNKGKEANAAGEGKGGKAWKAGDGKAVKKTSGAAGDAASAPMDISRLDLRVGKIVGVEKHPDADGLYVEQVDLGEDKPRTVVSGLVKHIPISAMRDRVAVFMCNLKPAKMRGIMSEGMIMCAVCPEKTEILVPPTDSAVGDKVTVKEYPGTPDAILNPKKKIWETLKPDVRTNDQRVATFKGAPLVIDGKGPVVAPTLADAQIS